MNKLKKETKVALAMGIPFGFMFAIGMVMALMIEWGTIVPGIIVGGIGLAGLISIFPIYRKVGHYPPLYINPRVVKTVVVGIITGLVFGLGMCLVLVPNPLTTAHLVSGIIIGLIGLTGCIVNPIIYFNK